MILNTIEDAAKYLPSLNLDLANNRLDDFFRRAQKWLVSHVIGETLEEVLETNFRTDEDHHAELRQLCQRVIAEIGLLDAIPEMDMQLTEAGFAVQNNDNFSPASSQRVDRLIAKMPERIAEDVDVLVAFLMKKSLPEGQEQAQYPDWRTTKQFMYLTAAFMPLMEDYNRRATQPATTYEEFFAALPIVAREMHLVAAYYVSRQEVERLLGLYRQNQLSEEHEKAVSELKDAAVFAFKCDTRRARNAASAARDVMLAHIDLFPAFAASDAAKRTTVNLDGGKTVNFL